MALRLTTTSFAQDDLANDANSLQAGNDTAALLAAMAHRSLSTRKLDEYTNLFQRATQIAHDVPRHRAAKLLIEAGLGCFQRATPKEALKALLATADGSLTALARDPAEPLLLNYAGVALYELWALDAAQALFEAAQRLDPEVAHIERNLKNVAVRRRQRPAGKGKSIHPLVRPLAKRAIEVAREARPATGKRISLCMIMRDEEEMLPRTLAAVAPAVDEIVIVDTGSHDRSIEIAKSFGAQVIEREWTGDFSAPRNASIDAATGDWIFYLDADEVLVTEDAEKLRRLAGETWHEACFIEEDNYTSEDDISTIVTFSPLRFFRNRPEYRFSGRLHEQVADKLPADLPERIGHSSVRLIHYGYTAVVREAKDKSRRNLELLEAQQRDGDDGPFMHYNLGSEYFALGELDRCFTEYAQAWKAFTERVDSVSYAHRGEFQSTLAAKYTRALRAAGHFEESRELAEQALEYFPGFTDLVFEQALDLRALGRDDEAIEMLKLAAEMGDSPSQYVCSRGTGTYLPRASLANYHMQRGEIAEALAQLRWCLERFPSFLGVLPPYVTAMARSGAGAEQILAEIEQLVEQPQPRVRFMLGVAFCEQGMIPAAELQFREVVKAQPHSGPARAALVETLTYQKLYAQAAEVAAAAEPTNRLATLLARSELLARLLGQDRDGARAALVRARRLQLADDELTLFEAWLSLLDGAESVPPIGAGALGLLVQTLPSLLSTRDFEGFATASKLFMALSIPLRERHEQMAQIYLRTGYLRSAGREWLAVCEHKPDLRALVGLAQVSLANQQPAPAAEFARQALALAPGDANAKLALEAAERALAGITGPVTAADQPLAVAAA